MNRIRGVLVGMVGKKGHGVVCAGVCVCAVVMSCVGVRVWCVVYRRRLQPTFVCDTLERSRMLSTRVHASS